MYAKPGYEVVIEPATSARNFQTSLDVRPNIRDLVVIGHSSRTAIHFNQDPIPGSNLSNLKGPNNVSPNDMKWSNVSKDGTIHLWGCNAGSQPDPIAQHIANAAGRTTEAYSNYTKLGATGPRTTGRSAGVQATTRVLGINLDDGSINGWAQITGGLETFEPELFGGGGAW
jgi:hypothetical protein